VKLGGTLPTAPEFEFAIFPEIIVHKQPDFVHIRAQTMHKRSVQSEIQNWWGGTIYTANEFEFTISSEIIVHKRPDFVHIRAQIIYKRSVQTEFKNSKLGGCRFYGPLILICDGLFSFCVQTSGIRTHSCTNDAQTICSKIK
jgi:hypothetical protein